MKQPVILCDDQRISDLLPLTFTRPAWDLRVGIFTQAERWNHLIDHPVFTKGSDYLSPHFDNLPEEFPAIIVNSRYIPDLEFVRICEELGPGEVAVSTAGDWLAARIEDTELLKVSSPLMLSHFLEEEYQQQTITHELLSFGFPEDLFRMNGELIKRDFPLATSTTPHTQLNDPYTQVYGKDNIFLAEGASVKAAILNAEDGPMYIGPGATISEGAIIARPHAFCNHSTVAMGAKLRGDTTVGPWSKVGGEVSNSIIMGYSNKGHDGYLGNAVIGYWCNLGADTNNSNLKNNYTNVKLWHYPTQRFRDTGLQFCGLIMGDHSKCAINTMFNTGTVVGVSANIFGAGFPRNFIPSFSWGGAGSIKSYRFNKAEEVMHLVMARRGMKLEDSEKKVLEAVFEASSQFRRF